MNGMAREVRSEVQSPRERLKKRMQIQTEVARRWALTQPEHVQADTNATLEAFVVGHHNETFAAVYDADPNFSLMSVGAAAKAVYERMFVAEQKPDAQKAA